MFSLYKPLKTTSFYLFVAGFVFAFLFLLFQKSWTVTHHWLLPLIYINLILLVVLIFLLGNKIFRLWKEKKQGLAGSKLHTQLITIFSLLSVAPGLLVAICSAMFFYLSIDSWFSKPVKTALFEAQHISESYLENKSRNISLDAYTLVRNLRDYNIQELLQNPLLLQKILTEQTEELGLAEAVVLNGNKEVLGRSQWSFTIDWLLKFHPKFDYEVQQARHGIIPILAGGNKKQVRALALLDPDTDTFVYIAKMVDPSLLAHLMQTKDAISEYEKLEKDRWSLEKSLFILFFLFSLLLVCLAILAGLGIADMLIRPIRHLIKAAESVSAGDFHEKVPTTTLGMNNEIGLLMDTFNHMMQEVLNQKQDLLSINQQLDYRRRFIETVLSKISAGVISISHEGKVIIINERASSLLSFKKTDMTSLSSLQSFNIDNIFPEVMPLLEEAREKLFINTQMHITRERQEKFLQVSVVCEVSLENPFQYIITFDDTTALVSAQRKAAWSDVARKIAHEIKNPLTPIQLAAERLRKRYLKEISSDPETFSRCVNTIIRQVDHIGHLVGEFSSFARMPEPKLEAGNIVRLCLEAMELHKQAHPEISFTFQASSSEILWSYDPQQMYQVLTNLLQNAINVLSEAENKEKNKKIALTIYQDLHYLVIMIDDNGPGFPVAGRERLTEPYYTTREKGTGLGLAIVAKIVEDHQGKLFLDDSVDDGNNNCINLGGARVRMQLKRSQ